MSIGASWGYRARPTASGSDASDSTTQTTSSTTSFNSPVRVTPSLHVTTPGVVKKDKVTAKSRHRAPRAARDEGASDQQRGDREFGHAEHMGFPAQPNAGSQEMSGCW
jgi:hypothetical protein